MLVTDYESTCRPYLLNLYALSHQCSIGHRPIVSTQLCRLHLSPAASKSCCAHFCVSSSCYVVVLLTHYFVVLHSPLQCLFGNVCLNKFHLLLGCFNLACSVFLRGSLLSIVPSKCVFAIFRKRFMKTGSMSSVLCAIVQDC